MKALSGIECPGVGMSTASNLHQAANLLCTQANSASYP